MWRLINIETGQYVERIAYAVTLTKNKNKALLIPDEKIKQFTKLAHESNKAYTYWPEEVKTKNHTLEIAAAGVWIMAASLLIFLANDFQKLFNNKKEPEIIKESIEVSKIVEEERLEEIPEIIKESIEVSKIKFAEEISRSVSLASMKYGIPEYVIYAIIATESGENRTKDINKDNISNVNKNARSKYDCIGLMQISPEHALNDYNKHNKTKYTRADLYNISTNIEIGTWYYSQFKVYKDWTIMYIIYNVGCGQYNKINKFWFYDYNGIWRKNYRNSFFYMNNLSPPTDNNHGMYGKNILKPYGSKKRFEKCLDICEKYLNY